METWTNVGNPIEDLHAALERALIDEYLAVHGQTLHSVRALPADQQLPLLSAATAYATLRLTEIESRSHYLDELDDGRPAD